MRYFTLIFITLFSLAATLPGQMLPEDLSFRFRKHQVDDGLSENTVYCILQDAKGFMWFGTKDGLNRFDGMNYKIYRATPDQGGLRNCFIRSMALSDEGILWLGTDVGVHRMDMATESFSVFDKPTAQGARINREVHSILIDGGQRVWMGTNEGLFLYDPAEDMLHHYTPGNGRLSILSSVVWSVYEDRSGAIWAGTREGLMKYDEPSGTFLDYSDPDTRTVGDDEIMTICEDANGNLWLGTWSGGVKRLERSTKQFKSFYKTGDRHEINHIRTIFDHSDDAILIGSDDGLYRMNKFTGALARLDKAGVIHSLSDKNVYSIYKDREGGMWVGTYFGGVNYLLPGTIELYTLDRTENSLSGRAVSQFCEDGQGNLWIATEDGGLNYFNTKTNTFENQKVPRNISYHNLHALMQEEDELWIGTFSRGIDVCNLRTGAIRNYRYSETNPATISDNCVFSLFKTSGGDIYAGTSFGVDRYNRNTRSFERLRSVDFYILDIKEDRHGDIWVATTGNGLLRYRPSDNSWTDYTHSPEMEQCIGHNKVTGILIDSKDRLWISTEGGGISLYDEQQDCFRTFTDRDGLANNVVYAMLEDDQGYLWLSTNKGINRFDAEDPAEILHYTQLDGLQSNEFNYRSGYRCSDGRMFFGGINGFNAFHPGDLVANPVCPPVGITAMHFLGEENGLAEEIQQALHRNGKLKLPHDRSSFTLSYVALSYISPAKNNYAYRLDGADDNWTMAGNQTSVTYVNLAPGQYVFRVKASNNSGVWNEEGTSLAITITPPWWRSRIALVVYILVFFLVVYYVILYFKFRYKKRSLQKIEEIRYNEEKRGVESKLSFFTSIAHEIRTPVSLIRAPLEAIIESGEGSEETRENLRTIEKNSIRLMELINQLLDFRKLDADSYKLKFQAVDIAHFVKDTTAEFRNAARKKNLTLHFKTDVADKVRIISDRDALTKILTNLLTNALKFSRRDVFIELTGDENKCFSIIVSDDGEGIPDEIKHKVFEPFFQADTHTSDGTGIGLSFARLMAEKLGGTLQISDCPSGGSRFTFSFVSMEELVAAVDELVADGQPEDGGEKSELLTILFVDDNPDMRKFVRNNLKKDYKIITARDADNGLEMMRKYSVDLLILDIMMPGTDGLTLSRNLRRSPEYCHLPIILLSAKNGVDTKVEGLDTGADVFIEKPFSPAHLKAQIDSLIANRNRIFEAFSSTPVSHYGNLVRTNKDKELLTRINGEIEKHLSDPEYNVDMIAEEMGMSRSNLQRKLKGVCGMTPNDYLRTFRLKRAAELLSSTDYRVNEVCYLVGFSSPSYFAKCFVKQFGVLPKEYNKDVSAT